MSLHKLVEPSGQTAQALGGSPQLGAGCWSQCGQRSRRCPRQFDSSRISASTARERDAALKACFRELSGEHRVHCGPVGGYGLMVTSPADDRPKPHRLLGAALGAAVRRRQSDLKVAGELSRSMPVGRRTAWSCATCIIMLVAMVVLLVAQWIVLVKWRDACALRVSEAFPAGSDPAMAAAWLCPLGLASDVEEEALGFSCDLLLPTTPPSLAGNASSFAVNAAALSIAVCGPDASIRSRPEVEAAFRSDYGWMLLLAFVVALLHGQYYDDHGVCSALAAVVAVCCLIVWGLVPALWVGTSFALRDRKQGGRRRIIEEVAALVLLAMFPLATAVGVVLFSQPPVDFDIGFVVFEAIDVITILLIAVSAFAQADSSCEPFVGERVLRRIEPQHGLRGFVTAHESRAALRAVQRRT
ncbi:hypothetical protein FNF29_02504 [Cafeteria roenbergensis]|uniref:Uncharacterized protein n=1 Tax=Cafeteria roenbergensis TaxID=33653 RepID=A0A5A8CPB2_CAFRO|nr:hypothetical protein FNF29_02504 [Cafeteria roenbergensis]|eukprot:KAA0154284.1 hypothetical protein FNF29_02504 [Cafeteria roenbergensis]